MAIFDDIANVKKQAEAEAAGDVNAHGQLLAAIRKLQLTAEKPVETTSRVNFQACFQAAPQFLNIRLTRQIMQNICVRVAVEKKFLQVIAENDSPITSAEIARGTNTEELLVGN